MRYDLQGFRQALSAASDPHLRLPPSIHVAGTNGKGSVVAYLASALQEVGFTVGTFTSPHIVSPNERIAVNGRPIHRDVYDAFLSEAKDVGRGVDITEFECVTLAAFLYFSHGNESKIIDKDIMAGGHEQPFIEAVDIVIWETGLGGRLDATNVIEPLCAVITYIGMDHQAFLGNTYTKIASEKAGIIKPHRPVITCKQRPEVHQVIADVATFKNCPLYIASSEPVPEHAKLQGKVQQINRGLAKQTLDVLFERHGPGLGVRPFAMSIQNRQLLVQKGFDRAFVYGRYQVISMGTSLYNNLVIDAAHNEDGLQALARQLQADKEALGDIHLIIGLSKPGDRREALKALSTLPLQSVGYCDFDNGGLSWPFAEVVPFFDWSIQLDQVSLDEVAKLLSSESNNAYPNPTKSALEQPKDPLKPAKDEQPRTLVLTGSIYFISKFYEQAMEIAI